MKHTEKIAAIITDNLPISQEAINQFLKLVEVKKIEKRTIFIQRKKLNHSEYFLLNGICRSFINDKEGVSISISFFQDRSVITPHVIRTADNVSNLSFEALTNCEIGIVNAEAFLNLMIENVEIRTFANSILKNELIQKVDKEINMASLNAKERLIALRKTYPNIENQIPHGMIASYLGITTISLSRSRKEISLAGL